jgi:hypothetical protein
MPYSAHFAQNVCDETSFASKGHTEPSGWLGLDSNHSKVAQFAIYQKVKIHFHGFPFFQRPKANNNKQKKKRERVVMKSMKIYILLLLLRYLRSSSVSFFHENEMKKTVFQIWSCLGWSSE